MEIRNHSEGNRYMLQLSGKFTFADNRRFRDIIRDISKPDIEQVLFDLEQLVFVDSAALGMLLLAHDETSRVVKKPIVLKNASGQVRKMLSLARFDQYFQIE